MELLPGVLNTKESVCSDPSCTTRHNIIMAESDADNDSLTESERKMTDRDLLPSDTSPLICEESDEEPSGRDEENGL